MVHLTKPLEELNFLERVCETDEEGILVETPLGKKENIIKSHRLIQYFQGGFIGNNNGCYGFIDPTIYYTDSGDNFKKRQLERPLIVPKERVSHMYLLED